MYPRLPDPPQPEPTDTAVLYSCTLLRWYLQTELYCTSTAEQLKLAEHAAHTAVTARGILPAAVDRVSAVRHAIAGQLALLARLQAESQEAPPTGCTGVQDARANGGQSGPSDGSGGMREPLRPFPRINPPAGVAVRPAIPTINF